MLTQKQIAELKREKVELEQKRLTLKEQCKNHRDMSAEDLNGVTDNLRTISDRVDEINDALKDVPAEEKRGVVFGVDPVHGSTMTEENFRSSLKYRDAFFRSFMSGKIAKEDADVMAFGKRAVTDMNGMSVTSGAEYLVPQTTLDQIQSIVTKYGAVYAAVTKYNFEGDVTIPIGTADAPTNNADGTDTLTFTFTEATINQGAVIATVSVKNLLLKNSIAGLEKYLAMEIGKYIGLQLENNVMNGVVATSKFLGLVTALAAAAEEYTDIDWELINVVQGDVDSPYGDDGSWIMTRKTFFTKFRSITDANGQPLTSVVPAGNGSGKTTYLIDGSPVLFTTRMTLGQFIYGDLSQYLVNESQELVIEADASAGFAADSTIWRGKVYAGGTVMFATDAFVYYIPAA